MKPHRIIDSHHHIWLKKDVPWLADEPRPRIFGPYEAIRRDYSVEEFQKDHGDLPVVKSVYVQCNWDPARAMDEAAWVQQVADEHGFPHGIVAFADLTGEDVEAKIESLSAFRNLCGIRHQIHWHANADWAYVPEPEIFNSPKWRAGLRHVASRGLPFDLQIFPSQMKAACALLDAFSTLPFILNHAGMPEDRSAPAWAMWCEGLREMSKRDNVFVKFSGLNTFEHRCSADLMRPIVQEVLKHFPAKRCMFGSNFPIEKLWTTYGDYVAALLDAVGSESQDDIDQIFFGTAAAVYKLN